MNYADLGRRFRTLSIAVASRILVLVIDTKATQASRQERERIGGRFVGVEAIVSTGRLCLAFSASKGRLSRRMAEGRVRHTARCVTWRHATHWRIATRLGTHSGGHAVLIWGWSAELLTIASTRAESTSRPCKWTRTWSACH